MPWKSDRNERTHMRDPAVRPKQGDARERSLRFTGSRRPLVFLLVATICGWEARAQDPAPNLRGLADALREPAACAVTAAAPATATPPKPAAAFGPAASAQAGPRLPRAMRIAAGVQIALDRRGFGCGLIDGRTGLKTRQALMDYGYAGTNRWTESEARQELLNDPTPAFVQEAVTEEDLAQVGDAPQDWEKAAELPSMACGSLIEWLSEKRHVSQRFLRLLNPDVTEWGSNLTGRAIWAPNVRPETDKPDVRQIAIDTVHFRLRGYDARGRLVCSFPCSIARDRAKVPTGELTVANVAPRPNYTFDPANFPESARAREIGHKLILPPGPRNPVGVYWISLSQPGFGIHGTPRPETIGNMESHGCFRLCNWDARTLGRAVTLGLPVFLDTPPRARVP